MKTDLKRSRADQKEHEKNNNVAISPVVKLFKFSHAITFVESAEIIEVVCAKCTTP